MTELDLVIRRSIDLPPEKIWRAWTEPKLVEQWFTPAPWTTADCEIDLRPGGAFGALMRSPDGQAFPHTGCYLEVVPHLRLVWTTALLPGFRPVVVAPEELPFTAIISLEAQAGRTK